MTHGTLSMANVTIHGNDTAGRGGGIFLEDVVSSLTGVTVSGNGGNHGGGIYSSCLQCPFSADHSNTWDNESGDYTNLSTPTGSDGNIAVDPEFLDTAATDPVDWDLHLVAGSSLFAAGDPALADPDGGTSDIGAFGGPGANQWDLDRDGYPGWWTPGPYDPATSPGMDCDDGDPGVFPGSGC